MHCHFVLLLLHTRRYQSPFLLFTVRIDAICPDTLYSLTPTQTLFFSLNSYSRVKNFIHDLFLLVGNVVLPISVRTLSIVCTKISEESVLIRHNAAKRIFLFMEDEERKKKNSRIVLLRRHSFTHRSGRVAAIRHQQCIAAKGRRTSLLQVRVLLQCHCLGRQKSILFFFLRAWFFLFLFFIFVDIKRTTHSSILWLCV